MGTNQNNKTVDIMLKELDEIFNKHYLKSKKNDKKYTIIINKIKKFKTAEKKQDLLYALEDQINLKKNFLSLESNIWINIFVILGLVTTVISDIVISNYNDIKQWPFISKSSIIDVTIILVLIYTSLYLCSIIKYGSKKNKKKCFYKFVYKVLRNEQ